MGTYDMLVHLDLETTGLNVRRSAILEVGAIATTTELESVAWFHRLTAPKGVALQTLADRMVPKVRDMHRDSGLWADLEQSWPVSDQFAVDEDLWQWLARLKSKHGARLVLCGSGSERFDRQLLESWMPRSAAQLHYAGADVSSVRMMAGWWAPGLVEMLQAERAGNPVPHRALRDVECGLAQMRLLREMFVGLAATSNP